MAETDEKKGKLPEDFPERELLERHNITTYAQLKKADLETLEGIGPATAVRINEASGVLDTGEEKERGQGPATSPTAPTSPAGIDFKAGEPMTPPIDSFGGPDPDESEEQRKADEKGDEKPVARTNETGAEFAVREEAYYKKHPVKVDRETGRESVSTRAKDKDKDE